MDMGEEMKMELKAGENTHENILFVCFGGMSNTGFTAALAATEAVKEAGLRKVTVGCLAGLPTEVGPVFAKTRAARRVITVDGCPFECSRKVVEKAGFKVSKSIVLSRDIGMIKKPLHEDIGKGTVRPLVDYLSNDEIRRAKELILKALNE
jgi:uncharacterized metal-binding protein